MVRQGYSNTQRLEQSLRIDPRVVLASQLLQLNQTELEQSIETELNENPALERLHDEQEPLSDERVYKCLAPQELRPSSDDAEFRRSLPNDDPAVDWLDLATSTPSLSDHLRAQLHTIVPKGLRHVGDYMVECLSETGYLDEPIEDIALMTESSIDDVEVVLSHLQKCEPLGVGARSVQECLLLQLSNDTFERKLARKILEKFLDEFIARRPMKIARRYRVMPEVVERAFDEILSLTPFPADGFAHGGASHSKSYGVSPDIVISRSESGWTIEVKGPEPSSLHISRAYRRRLKELGRMEHAPKDEKRHIGHYVQRAEEFISCLEQRRKTMRAIAEYLVREQSGFVSTGDYSFLKPLTRTQMAQDLGMHESTISRATADKFVQISNGEVVSFDVFFKPALRVQKMIEEILSHENPGSPLSDERIAELLAKKGVFVARRTVHKYRDRTRLLSSRKRRSA